MKFIERPVFFLLPLLVFILSMIIFPMVFSLYVSFSNWTLVGPRSKLGIVFSGFNNYMAAFNDPSFHNSLTVTAQMTVLGLALQLPLGLGIALLMSREFRGRSLVRTLIVLPIFMTPLSVALMWKWMLNSSYGIVDYALNVLGLPSVQWLGKYPLVSLVIIDTWQWTPFLVLVLLAGLQSMPVAPFESAQIDGATRFQMLRYITLPLLRPALLLALIFRFTDIFRMFDVVFAATSGGPGQLTESLSFFVFKNGLIYWNEGYASALSYIMVLIMSVVAFVFISRVKWRQQ